MPKLPTTPEEINLQDHWTQTLAHERFLLCDDRNEAGNRILLFATDANLQRLCASSTVYSDGTFYSCTSLFTQLYTLHADVEGTVFPLVFALLPNKTEATYRRLFSLLRTAVNERQSALTPETWMTDIEVACSKKCSRRDTSKYDNSRVFFSLHTVYLEESSKLRFDHRISRK